MSSTLPSQIESAHAADRGQSSRTVAAKLARITGATLLLVCGIIFGRDLLLDRGELGKLFCASLAALLLFLFGQKVTRSSAGPCELRSGCLHTTQCRRECPLDSVRSLSGVPTMALCECQPWQCGRKNTEACRSLQAPDTAATCAVELSGT